MSLEENLVANTAATEKNTAAVEALTAAWLKLASQAKGIDKLVESGEAVATTLPGGDKVMLEKPAPKDAAASQPAATDAAKGATSDAAADITYEQVGKAITEGVKVSKDHVIAVLAQFGAKKGPELKKEQYAEFLAALKAEPEVALA